MKVVVRRGARWRSIQGGGKNEKEKDEATRETQVKTMGIVRGTEGGIVVVREKPRHRARPTETIRLVREKSVGVIKMRMLLTTGPRGSMVKMMNSVAIRAVFQVVDDDHILDHLLDLAHRSVRSADEGIRRKTNAIEVVADVIAVQILVLAMGGFGNMHQNQLQITQLENPTKKGKFLRLLIRIR